ncbi:hypothetical protein C8N35_10211 [Breoghania corrubedonensis]|uniref:DUF6898 domain-containing protein n=1 Tax=Breoghania corrubedonensis TaxID=665038 RepID=A0A2T5VC27_9HYPH|nr:serine hydroxymethyltransferase [Breoghania corrubedonensis]PTW61302.1 hypothetical protein C8N35_10211 [Breoghania corrubedonensis]
MTQGGTPSGPGRIFLEFTRVGRQVKVSAIDEATGVEVSMIGPLTVSQEELGRLAVRKLKRRLEQGGA